MSGSNLLKLILSTYLDSGIVSAMFVDLPGGLITEIQTHKNDILN